MINESAGSVSAPPPVTTQKAVEFQLLKKGSLSGTDKPQSKEPKARITNLNKFYVEGPTLPHGPMEVSGNNSVDLDGEAQPYHRVIAVSEAWTHINYGWLEENKDTAGHILILSSASHTVEIGLFRSSHGELDTFIPLGKLRANDTFRIEPCADVKFVVRSVKGGRLTVSVVRLAE